MNTDALPKLLVDQAIDAAHRAALHRETMTLERALLRNTLTASVQLMVDALELTDPLAAAVQRRVKGLVQELCTHFGVPYDWHLMAASSVCLIGLLGTQRDRTCPVPVESMLADAAALGSKLVTNLPLMESVARMLAHQREVANLPEDLDAVSRAVTEQIGARFLKISVDLAFALGAGLTYGSVVDYFATVGQTDPRLIDALALIPTAGAYCGSTWVQREIKLADIRSGMVLEDDLTRSDGTLLLSRGQSVSTLAASNLRSQAANGVLTNTVQVRIRSMEIFV